MSFFSDLISNPVDTLVNSASSLVSDSISGLTKSLPGALFQSSWDQNSAYDAWELHTVLRLQPVPHVTVADV